MAENVTPEMNNGAEKAGETKKSLPRRVRFGLGALGGLVGFVAIERCGHILTTRLTDNEVMLGMLGAAAFLVFSFIGLGTVGFIRLMRFVQLTMRAYRFLRQKKYVEAERDYQKILRILEKNKSHRGRLEVAKTLCNLALVYEQMREDGKAEPLLQRAMQIRETAFGFEHSESAPVLESLALLFQRRNDFAQAEALHLRALSIREKAFGLEHAATAYSLNNLATLYSAMGDFTKAEPLLQRALSVREKALGPEHEETVGVLFNLATLYETKGDFAKAEPLSRRALLITEKILGPEDPRTAGCLNNLAAIHFQIADYAKADLLYQRALQIAEKVLGAEHPDTASSLNNLALLYQDMGDYAKAEPLQQRALQIQEKVLGPEHPVTAGSLDNLASLYSATADYAKAEPLYQRALQIREKVLGPNHPDTAYSLNNLAGLYKAMGDYAKAEPLYQRALEIVEKALGPDHPNTATILDYLASFYSMIGDHSKAEPLCQRALEIREKALGSEHPDTAISLDGLAALYIRKEDYLKAEPLCQRALKICEKVLGPENRITAMILQHLAVLYNYMEDYAKAEPLHQRALQIREKVLGPEHPDTANSLNNLAALYQCTGDYAKAEPLYQRALQIGERAQGSEFLRTAWTRVNLGRLLVVVGRQSEALPLARQTHNGVVNFYANVLSFTSESQRLAFQAQVNPYALFGMLGSAPDLALAVFQFKGVVLDSLLEDRLVAQASDNPETRALVDRLRLHKHRLNQLVFETPTDLSDPIRLRREDETKRLTLEAERLESTLARHVAGLGRARRSLSVTVEQVQAVIPKEAVLLEWLRYEHDLGRKTTEKRYGVIVLASSGEAPWISLGSAEAIEKNIEQYRAAMRGEAGEAGPKSEVQSPKPGVGENPISEFINHKSEIEPLLRRLHEQLWSPIEAVLPPGTKTVILSPDGALNFLSFATLLTPDDQFLSQKYSIRYVASGRDLLREFQSPTSSRVTVFANPDFSGQGSSPESSPDKPGHLRLVEMRDFQHLELPPLPGTARESAALAAQAQQWNWPIAVFEGAEANQTRLREVSSPRILHLATHGFFLPENEIEKHERVGTSHRGVGGIRPFEESGFMDESSSILKPRRILKNPMHRSGLALAGAQTTLNAWQRGETSAVADDGIVTAEEVGTLKLEGTQLVVLSACDTGAGEARSGEGVLGLRRGFIQAGAKNLLMTLWCVADEETVEIMADFYETFHSSGNAPQALADVQREWLVRLRQERGLQSAVSLAGPFILSSQGPLA